MQKLPEAVEFVLLVSVVAETSLIQDLLRDHGIDVETVSEVQPIRIMPARILSHIYVKLGKPADMTWPF